MEEKEDKKEDSAEEKKEERKKHEHELDIDVKKNVQHHHYKHSAKQHKKPQLTIKKTTLWQVISAVLAVVLIVTIAKGGSCAGAAVIDSEEAGESAVTFINDYLLDGSTEAVLKGAEETNNLYKISFDVDGKEYPSYVSTDGELLFLTEAIEMSKVAEEAESASTEPAPAPDLPKSEKPEVELFVMSHCPYGTQIEKGMIPVAQLLGDKIDFSVRFVYYAMHGKTEVDEQLRQHCIQREQNDKYLDYLTCFLEAGESDSCLASAGIDAAGLEGCVQLVDDQFNVTNLLEDQSSWMNGRFPQFNIDSELNTKYGVKGSPHLVINGQSASTGRDSASLLRAVCAAFTTAPEECDAQLSSASPSPGFGFDAAGSAAAGSCS